MTDNSHFKYPSFLVAAILICLLAAAAMLANSSIAFAEAYTRKDISQQQWLRKTMKDMSTKPLLLDVRSPAEFKQGHIKGAINIPHNELDKRLAELGADKKRPVVVYCRSGKRAGKAERVLHDNGFTHIKHLEGDMNAWLAAKRPVESCSQC
jgi:rhodanese-related sulfurtransferase